MRAGAGAALPPGVDAAAATTLRRAVELSYVSGLYAAMRRNNDATIYRNLT